ncbi:MAG: NAD(P)/FAD-dependent oxidoreductase [Planctomycetota bacterium]|nr:MAG: NAD(P)/FAD-dependent oxidoreductase [Planctomycetota bacterium]
MSETPHHHDHQHIVIVGGGFGGLYAALGLLRERRFQVTLIDRQNHHCFQPLLYQVATGGLSPGNIAMPLRSLLANHKRGRVLLDEVLDVHAHHQQIVLASGTTIAYDHLIVAAGMRCNRFGHDAEWGTAAPGMKTLDDALYLRRRIFENYELAERCNDPRERQRLLTFVICGGGPTGVEMAGAIAELGRSLRRHEFHHLTADDTKVILLEASASILTTFPQPLQDRARQDLTDLGVDVRCGWMVDHVDHRRIVRATTSDQETREHIDHGLFIWAAGVQGVALAQSLAIASNESLKPGGRVLVDEYCRLPGHPHIAVIGDLAYHPDHRDPLPLQERRALPGIAPVAMQQGRYLAKRLRRELRGRAVKPFRYRDKGAMAVIGRNRAVGVTGPLKMRGRLAWWAWLFIHIMYLSGTQNRILVLLQWAWAFFSRNRGARLITGAELTEQALLSRRRSAGAPAHDAAD